MDTQSRTGPKQQSGLNQNEIKDVERNRYHDGHSVIISKRRDENLCLAVRYCGPEGLWMGRRENEFSIQGWTNYMPCFPPQVQRLLLKVYEDVDNAQYEIVKLPIGASMQ
ncbi:hypothetical protein EVAR_66978_1 [Eumeta japonica]|uniref:Uncharacterized protein n=1 Tax=Eumeta variegata TaxID=151549 RepID=A0A4C1ZR40_EUMVA|nr:hypothetical protein EVAR_66978_1 [Eumeta japonica]